MASTEKKSNSNWIFWLSVFAIFCLFVYLTKSVIMPFVAGILIGYLLDPLVKKLTKYKINRTIATAIILLAVLIIIVPGIVILIGAIDNQIIKFINSIPTLTAAFINKADPILKDLSRDIPSLAPENIKAYLQENMANAVKLLSSVAGKIIKSGFAFVNIISLLIITPVVTFYMLRDWEVFTKHIDSLLPMKSRSEIRSIAKKIDKAIAAFLRGQFSVCVILGSYYSLGLYIVGLQLGIVVGFVAGIISFVPYVGSITGFITAIVIAFVQFDSIGPIIQVVAVFAIGQLLEGNFLTPKLVGDSVGLHPVWIMFSILAGGVLLGFLGVMIAVPLAAIIGVLTRHFIAKYKKSDMYRN